MADGQPCLPYSDPDRGGLWAVAEDGSASGRAEGEPLAHSRALHVRGYYFYSGIHQEHIYSTAALLGSSFLEYSSAIVPRKEQGHFSLRY